MAPCPRVVRNRVQSGRFFQDITDGTSNTILAVEANRDIPWTKPEDIPFDPNRSVTRAGRIHAGRFHGGVRRRIGALLEEDDPPDDVKALITRDGGEVISSDSF